jgi:hypothetical protein
MRLGDIPDSPGPHQSTSPSAEGKSKDSNKRKRGADSKVYMIEGPEEDPVNGQEEILNVEKPDFEDGEDEKPVSESGESECIDNDEERDGETKERGRKKCQYLNMQVLTSLQPPKCSKTTKRRPSRSPRSDQASFTIKPCPRGGVSFTSWSALQMQSLEPRMGERAAAFIASLGGAGGDYANWSNSCDWVEGLVNEFGGHRGALHSSSQVAFFENSLDNLLLRCQRGDVVESSSAFIQSVNFIQLLAKVKR